MPHPPRRVTVLINAKAGSVDSNAAREEATRLREAFSVENIDADVHLVPGPRLADAARQALAARPDALVAVGGDGTVSAVAGVLAASPEGSSVPLGIIPKGTLNHFAKDLNLPLDPDAAIKVIAAGHTRAVDAAAVNDRTFINNSSIGLYPHVVRDRDQQREQLGRGKWLAMFFAILSALRRFPLYRVRLAANGQSVTRTTPFVFVGNNEYEMTLYNIGTRKCLDAGKLCLYVAHRTGRFGMLLLALRALFGKLQQARDFDATTLDELWIDSRRHRLHVALDGEVELLSPPLHYTIRPAALRVFAPPQ